MKRYVVLAIMVLVVPLVGCQSAGERGSVTPGQSASNQVSTGVARPAPAPQNQTSEGGGY
jgi:hypothetical protein